MALSESGPRCIRGASIWWRCDPWLDGRYPDLRCPAASALARQHCPDGLDADAICDCTGRMRADLDLAHGGQAAAMEAHRERRTLGVHLRRVPEGIPAHGRARAAAISRHRSESNRIA